MQNEKENQKGSLSWSTPSQPTLAATKPTITPTKAQPSTPSSHVGTYAGLLAGGIIIGVLLSWGWSTAYTNKSISSIATSTTAGGDSSAALSSTGAQGTMSMNSSLMVNSPQKAGDTVAIASVSIAKPTWVVVYEENNGQPGNALGARLLNMDSENVAVTLLRDTTPGEQYLVGESLDDGSHVFSLKDARVTDENGQTLWASFTAQ